MGWGPASEVNRHSGLPWAEGQCSTDDASYGRLIRISFPTPEVGFLHLRVPL